VLNSLMTEHYNAGKRRCTKTLIVGSYDFHSLHPGRLAGLGSFGQPSVRAKVKNQGYEAPNKTA
jgi:hypothetical protein